MEYELIKLALEEETSLFSANQLGHYLATALLTVINLLVAFFVLKKFVFPLLAKILKNREETIKNQLDEAEKTNAAAKENLEQSTAAIDKAKSDAATIVEESRENANKQASDIVKKAETEASEIIARAEEEAKRIKKTAFEEANDQLSDLAFDISSRVIGEATDSGLVKDLSVKYTAEALDAEVKKLDD